MVLLHGADDEPIQNSCLHQGFVEDMSVEIDIDRISDESMRTDFANYKGHSEIKGIGQWEKCYVTAEKYTLHDMPFYKRCYGNNTCAYDEFDVDNDIMKLMNGKTLFAFSGFWHAADQFLGLGGDFNIDRFEEKSKVQHTQEKRHLSDKIIHLYWTSF